MIWISWIFVIVIKMVLINICTYKKRKNLVEFYRDIDLFLFYFDVYVCVWVCVCVCIST